MSQKRLCMISCVVALALALTSLSSASLVGWWAFDETSGTVAHDTSGSGNDGTLNGNPTWVAGYYDGALKLNGTSDYVQLNVGLLIPTLKECTFSIWVNWVGGASWQRFIDIGTGTADYIYFVPADASRVLHVAIVANNGVWDDLATGNPLPTDGWHHVAATVSASAKTMIIYVDGQVVGSDITMTNSVDAIGVTTNNWLGRSQYAADPYFNGTIDDFRIYNTVLSQADVQNVMANVISVSSRPTPANNATDVRPDAALGWRPGQFAVTHDVYLGTNSSDVAAASRTSTNGVLVSQGQDANTYDLPGLMTLGQTYYWRVDEINAPASPGTAKGNVWNFAVEPVAYAVLASGITVTASSAGSTAPPINTINGSGMTGDLHSTDNKAMWLTTSSGPKPAWIRYDFDRLYKLSELWVWNQNTPYEAMLGFGAKSTTIEYSSDGTTWTKLGDFQFTQAPGTDDYAHNSTISLGGVAAKSVRITVNSSWTSASQTGLSEVRFYYTPVVAREPKPASGSTGIDPSVTLSWRPGREAVSHKVYIGTDANAVKASTTAAGTVSTPSYAPAGLQLGTTYYWRVDEVNAAQAVSTWAGDVWSLSTSDFLVVDDMESYNDTSNQIFNVWVDGYGTTTNGSVVGYNTSTNGTFGETAIIHGGKQSMPLAYNNSGTFTGSEATRTFGTTQDWTAAGIKTLVVFFQGISTNSSGQLYVKINSVRVDYPGNAAGLAAPLWKQWNIDLASISGVKAVKTVTIGVTGSGKGTLYFDDIRLYRSAPAVVQPANPGTTNLMAYFPFEGDAKDASGHNYAGTLNTITFADSMSGFGKAAQFNGTTGYVDLGTSFGSLIGSLTNSTSAAWVRYTGTGAVWQRVFDFGSSTAVYMFLSTRNTTNFPRFAIIATGKTEINATASRVMSVGWHHLTGVIDASTMTMALYVDGSLAQGNVPTTILPKDLGATTQNWVGRSQWTADPYLNGSVDDLRVYNRVLTEGEIRYLVGDR